MHALHAYICFVALSILIVICQDPVVSIRAGNRVHWPAVRMTLSAWFGHPEKVLIKKFRSNVLNVLEPLMIIDMLQFSVILSSLEITPWYGFSLCSHNANM